MAMLVEMDLEDVGLLDGKVRKRKKASETPDLNDERMSMGSTHTPELEPKEYTPDEFELNSVKLEVQSPPEQGAEMDMSFQEAQTSGPAQRSTSGGQDSARVARQACEEMLRSTVQPGHPYYQ
jgi:hypothetical protein